MDISRIKNLIYSNKIAGRLAVFFVFFFVHLSENQNTKIEHIFLLLRKRTF